MNPIVIRWPSAAPLLTWKPLCDRCRRSLAQRFSSFSKIPWLRITALLTGAIAANVAATATADTPPAATPSDAARAAADADQAADEPTLPVVLVLGDSISIGYTPHLGNQLQDVATVVRPMRDAENAENCAGTKHGVASVDRWLEQAGQAAVITFNFGLHDLKREKADGTASNDPADPPQSDIEAYRAQLSEITDRLLASGAKLYYVTTTPVPPGKVSPHRDLGDPVWYNAVARQVVQARGVDVIDLYSVAAANPSWQRPANVHFTDEGSAGLAQAIAEPLRLALADLDKALAPQRLAAAQSPWEADAEVVERSSRSRNFLYREADVPQYSLPELLQDAAGQTVTADRWAAHRGRLLQTFRDQVYGNVPQAARDAAVTYTPIGQYEGRHLSGQLIETRISSGGADFTFPFLLYLPLSATSEAAEPVPVVVLIHNREFPDLAGLIERPSPFAPVEMLVKRGYAVAIFHTSHVDPDDKDGFDQGIRGFFTRLQHGSDAGIADRQPADWGALAAWAWGASRVVDHLVTLPQIDDQRIAVIGHSRGGKTALWAAAEDPRFSAVFVNQSGCGGAALSRRRYGETIARITSVFPHWFAINLNQYAEAEDQLPIDQHQLFALVAPRAAMVGSAAEDLWADPRGEYLSLAHAAPAYRLLGQSAISDLEMPPLAQPRFEGRTGYIVRPDKHNLREDDWAHYLDFWGSQPKP